jgi:TetR/AcrR family transcriptional regulator, tetracycline repressor protein
MVERKRGRPSATDAAITSEAVVAAGLELLDESGPPGLSMRVLADRLGTYPSTIYWHVGDKNRLLTAIVSVVLREVAAPDPEATPWDDWLREVAHSYRRALHRHPHVGSLVASQLTADVLALDLPEAILAVLAHAGFAGSALADAYNAYVGSVVGWVSVELSGNPAATDDWQQEFAGTLRSLPADRFPTITSHLDVLEDQVIALRWHGGAERAMDHSFAVALDVWIAGLTVQRRKARGRR